MANLSNINDKFLVTTGGNVGINVTGPVTKLEVSGSITNSSVKFGTLEMQSYSVNNAWLADNVYYNGAWYLRSTGYASQVYFGSGGDISFKRFATGNAGTVATPVLTMQLDSAGNVGIAKSQSGNAVLTVKSPAGGNTGIILIEGDTTDDGWGVYATTANKYIITRFTGGSYSDKFTILEGGEVGIANTNPLFELCIGAVDAPNRNGLEFAISNSDAGTNILQNYNRATAAYTPMSIAANEFSVSTGSAATEKMRITSTGAISVGSTGTNYGASGEVLISNGNISPTWGSATSVSEDNYWKIDDGLNFHLAFKEGSGTTVADISGGRKNFTAGVGLDWTETGKFGYAQEFNGSNSYLSGTGPSSNITTFSAWVNNDGDGGIQNIVSGTYIMAYVSIYNNNFQVYDGVGWRNGGAVPANEWVHVAFSYDAAGTSGGLQKMYVNGVLGYSATAVGYTGVSNYISKVGIFTGAIRYFNGEITNIQTWDRILGDSEILSLYNQYPGNGGNVSEASLWTVKAIQSGVVVNGVITLSDLTHTYTYNGPHALYISGGFTTTPATSGVTYSAHFSMYVDGNLVGLADQHDTPPEWWRQSFAFMTPNYTSGQHTITVTGTNQDGNFNIVDTTQYSQIVYRIIPL